MLLFPREGYSEQTIGPVLIEGLIQPVKDRLVAEVQGYFEEMEPLLLFVDVLEEFVELIVFDVLLGELFEPHEVKDIGTIFSVLFYALNVFDFIEVFPHVFEHFEGGGPNGLHEGLLHFLHHFLAAYITSTLPWMKVKNSRMKVETYFLPQSNPFRFDSYVDLF